MEERTMHRKRINRKEIHASLTVDVKVTTIEGESYKGDIGKSTNPQEGGCLSGGLVPDTSLHRRTEE